MTERRNYNSCEGSFIFNGTDIFSSSKQNTHTDTFLVSMETRILELGCILCCFGIHKGLFFFGGGISLLTEFINFSHLWRAVSVSLGMLCSSVLCSVVGR